MKRVLLILLVVGLIVGAGSIAWAKIQGTPHDFAAEPCAECHTPHNATTQYPLWNRTQTGPASYTMYTSPTFDMGPADTTGLRYPSSLCMVCHNGVASTLVNYPGPCSDPDTQYDVTISGCDNLGSDLSNDHPIGFNYVGGTAGPDADNDGFPDTIQVGTGSRQAINGSATHFPLYSDGSEWNHFECGTCHTVHNTETYNGQGVSQVYFLRQTNEGSALCQQCHVNR